MEKLEEFDILLDEYSKEFVEFLKVISIKKGVSFEEIYLSLPASDLVKKEEELIYSYPIQRVILGIADPCSYVLTYFKIMGAIPEDYPEQPRYIISLSEGEVDAPFIKQEFIESIKKTKTKKLEIK